MTKKNRNSSATCLAMVAAGGLVLVAGQGAQAACTAPAGACQASNFPDPAGNAFASNGTTQRVADNLQLAANDVITSVCWNGIFGGGTPLADCSATASNEFTIRIYTNANCFPDQATTFNVTATRTPVGAPVGGFQEFQFDANIGFPYDASLGCRWIEITHPESAGCNFFWSTSASDTGDSLFYADITPADPYAVLDRIQGTGDMAFCVGTSTNQSLVNLNEGSCGCPILITACTGATSGQCQDREDAAIDNSSATTFVDADAFVLDAGGSVTSICWWGGYRLGGTTPGTDCSNEANPDLNFTIRILPTIVVGTTPLPDATAPIATLTSANSTITGVFTGFIATGGGLPPMKEFSYKITPNVPVPVSGGQCFWVEIKGPELTPPTGCRFRWRYAADGEGDGFHFQKPGADATYEAIDQIAGDKAMCIIATPNQPLGALVCAGPPPIIGACADPGTLFVTQNSSQIAPAGGIACAGGGITTENSYARSYNLGVGPTAGQPVKITCVEIGVANSSTTAALSTTVNLYADTNGGAPQAPGVDLTLLGSASFTLPINTPNSLAKVSFTTPICVPANTILVVEWDIPEIPEGQMGFATIAANSNPETGPTYLRSASCGFNEFVTMASIGFPAVHWLQNLRGTIGCGGQQFCDEDLFPVNNPDGTVGPGDLGQLLSQWGPCPGCDEDIFPVVAGDGVVGPGDLGQLLSQWGQCP